MNHITLTGVSENNLKNLSLSIPHDQLVVISGLSGSGKSTLAFDTLYAEGGRRYIETFSPYTRQFLDRLHPPALEAIHGVRPALALEQRNRITSSRSTVGTITEINDYLKVIWTHFSELLCENCDEPIRQEPVEVVVDQLVELAGEQQYSLLLLGFTIRLEGTATLESLRLTLLREGHIRYLDSEQHVQRIEELGKLPDSGEITIITDRVQLAPETAIKELRARLRSSVAQSYLYGHGSLIAWLSKDSKSLSLSRQFSECFRCNHCHTSYKPPRPSLFSFNSPLGACAECHGFGKILQIDRELCVPDRTKSIRGGAIHCWSTDATSHLKKRLVAACEAQNISTSTPWKDLPSAAQDFVFNGAKKSEFKGILAWFSRLEQKRHKMHVRVLLARYRSEQNCTSCSGTRLQSEALRYRVNNLTLPELWDLPIDQVLEALSPLLSQAAGKEGIETALLEIQSRLKYLCDIGLPYLTLNRQSRTLSGGESQRVNLTSLLGANLVHTMIVLDEPTIGLHPRDTARLIETLLSLRARNNTLVVVEHDPEVIRAADRVIDLGPGAGAAGGEIIAMGSPQELAQIEQSRTGRYLREGLQHTRKSRSVAASTESLTVHNAHAHNLKNIDVRIPLNSLVCITGASGSGKSTLIHSCLVAGYQKLKQGFTPQELKDSPTTGLSGLSGLEHIDQLVVIDQSPIGKSPRSNPATYTKAWDIVRDLLASTEQAQRLGLSKSAFSFNVDGGRCPACKGAGRVKIEMQFLADVYVVCEHCNGTRFQDSVLSATIAGKNVVELLNTPISDALALFALAANPDIYTKLERTLRPLLALGLGYLTLGHPLSALSGGEAQRVKLAAYLGDETAQRCVFVLDEPTTGLHPDNINDLLLTFDALLSRGHSIICIEHNLDVISQADWLIDLGPDGGRFGGELLCEGAPRTIAKAAAKHKRSATARYLADYYAGEMPTSVPKILRTPTSTALEAIEIRGAREHNLKEVSVSIPQNKIVAITGVSGSGKSTLAFDIVFAEGQRRYINCLSPYARQYIKQLSHAVVDQVRNLPPTIAISQKTAPPQGISTVATTTEIYQFLRLLFAKAGTQHCVKDDLPITSRSSTQIVEQIRDTLQGKRVYLFAPVVSGRKGYYNELFARAVRAEISQAKIDGSLVSISADLRLERHKLHWISLLIASLTVRKGENDLLRAAVEQALTLGNGVLELYTGDPHGEPKVFSIDRVCPKCAQGYRELDPQDFSFRSARGMCNTCGGRGIVPLAKKGRTENSRATKTCPSCAGARIAAVGRHVYFGGKSINELSAMTAPELLHFLDTVVIEARLANVVKPILRELTARLSTIVSIGLEYLSLNRDASTLSGGEAQRLRLAKTLGSPLTGVCYVLDEPSIGLHSQDHAQLLQTLAGLRDQGNTVIVVEHDEDTIRAADHVIDVGPGGGKDGGSIVFEGTVTALEESTLSRTGIALRERRQAIPTLTSTSAAVKDWFSVRGAFTNNLKHIDFSIPLERYTVVCGVSGAGKSSLVHGTLIPAIVETLEGEDEREEYYDKTWKTFSGGEKFERFLEIDQSPVGKTSSSAPVSYLGIFDAIRKIYAQLPEAKVRGWNASHFSFNTGKGRCPHCEGRGEIVIPMSFMPDATTLCEYCNGLRYTDETLEVEHFGVSIGRLLKSTFAEAYELFANHRLIRRSLSYVLELGLGYLTLGQPTHTLSGGEAQRIKIARELGAREASNTLYVLDEPTIGLHMTDVDRLNQVLRTLVEKGNTVVVIEHNLDIIRGADYLLEVGPGPGSAGGELLFAGTPAELLNSGKKTPTSAFLVANPTPDIRYGNYVIHGS
jgi:excinuclease ABC subunit A